MVVGDASSKQKESVVVVSVVIGADGAGKTERCDDVSVGCGV